MAAVPPASEDVLDVIGNTRCVKLRHVVPEGCADVFLKLESLNPTGSYKDRMARSIVEEAELRGGLKPGTTLVEATGGSTGSSLAFVCAIKGYEFQVVCSDAFSTEKLRTMAAFGAKLDLVLSPTKRITPDLFPSMRERAHSLAQRPDHYFVDQFNNKDALVGYRILGEELLQQLPDGVDGFCAAVGGAGMIMGVAKVLKSQSKPCEVVVLEPEAAPFLTTGRGGVHGIEGIGAGMIPPLLDKALYDEV
ncbi:hypothetical protein JX265_000823 [Neoarthrinium moseri]|uniref:Tryptophan synthase beta chain-like PALP domain-containing protein n=1 Tax=Neoarthrinium moseri TaxID=1658444 RepID=A0A9P9WWX4_9PEZI|nr:hypothetical protein JX265_000823 [Neoarthrinium moseri]